MARAGKDDGYSMRRTITTLPWVHFE